MWAERPQSSHCSVWGSTSTWVRKWHVLLSNSASDAPHSQVVNTVNFSNHAGASSFSSDNKSQNPNLDVIGYGRFGGTRTSAVELDGIFESMRENELLSPTRLLTGTPRRPRSLQDYNVVSGYTAGPESLRAVANVAARLKKANPDLIYLLDRTPQAYYLMNKTKRHFSRSGRCGKIIRLWR